ncbi:MAG: CPBP family intramembrane metalloprotease [Spirochaetaceae bacterium]|nr:CPBP family intramembrane metalloprotease [Spirochaetaceae bacterium]
MKTDFLQKHADFFLIFAFFAIPPLFISSQPSFSPAAPLLSLIVYVALSAYILVKSKFGKNDFKAFSAVNSFLLLCMLLVNAKTWDFATILFDKSQNELTKTIPEGFWENAYIVFSIFVSALYEELLFRQFLPEGAFSFVKNFSKTAVNAKIARICTEIAIIMIFAMGHRYLGVWAVLNAFTAGCILRFFCIRTGSFISGFTAHFVYNLIVFFVL